MTVITSLKTKRGRDALGHKGYIYHFHSSNSKRTRKYWRCEQRTGCNARMTTNFLVPYQVLADGSGKHQHQPDLETIEVSVTRAVSENFILTSS